MGQDRGEFALDLTLGKQAAGSWRRMEAGGASPRQLPLRPKSLHPRYPRPHQFSFALPQLEFGRSLPSSSPTFLVFVLSVSEVTFLLAFWVFFALLVIGYFFVFFLLFFSLFPPPRNTLLSYFPPFPRFFLSPAFAF